MSTKPRAPKEALIAITYRCNARCHMCNTWQFPSRPEEELMPEDLLSLPKVVFCNITGGEPFIREDIGEFVRVMRAKAKRIVVSTNGYFTDRIVALAQKNRDIGIRVSIEGIGSVNDDLRGLKNGFERGLRTLLELDRLGLKDIGFGITLSDRNIQDVMGLYQLSKRLRFEFATACVHNGYYFHIDTNTVTRLDDFKAELEKLINELLAGRKVKEWFRAYFNYGLYNYAAGKKRLLPCNVGSDLFFIDPFGSIKPCNVMDESMGNLKQETFERIWNSSRAGQVRDAVKACGRQCWMIGSVAPAMKKDIRIPLLWVAKQKLLLARGKKVRL